MAKIKFFALGGLGEIGKNMYILEVEDRIFILDAGSKFPSSDLLGIDNVYPNISYLEKNKDRIVGLFLTHGHEEHIGATIEILKRFNIGVHGSHFTISVLEQMLKEEGLNLSDYRLYRINDNKELSYNNLKVRFYYVSHSIPETMNIAIITEDGAIVYAPDFTFDVTSNKRYKISFDKISEISNQNVIALASGSLGALNVNGTHNNYALETNVSQLAMKNKRIFISLYSNDLVKLQRVIDICLAYNRRIAIIGRKTQKLISIATATNYIDVPEEKFVNLKFRTEEKKNDDSDLAIIVTGLRHEPYYSILRMCKGEDRLVKIEKGDEVLFICPPETGCENISSRTIDEILLAGAKYYSMKKEELRSSYADSEELKLLYSMLKPRYIIPINGEFRHQYVQKKIAMQQGYKEKEIIILQNGEVASFEDGDFKGLIDHVSCGDVMVDGGIVGDVNDVVLKDRELMSEDGIVIVSILIDRNNKKIIDGAVVQSCGVLLEEGSTFLQDLEQQANQFIESFFLMKEEEINSSTNELLRSYLMNYMYQNTNMRPILVPSVIEI